MNPRVKPEDDEEVSGMSRNLRKCPIKSAKHRFDRRDGDVVITPYPEKFIQTLGLNLDVRDRFGTGKLSA